jgi:hypothetical protein
MQIALVPYQVTVDANVLTQVAAALQRQVSQHFAPLWNIDATVSAFTDYNSVPLDYTRLVLVDHLDNGSLGVHRATNGQPYALVGLGSDWPIVASHELLELLADPSGSTTRSGPSPMGGSIVDFLVEVCDPCQGEGSAYTVDGVSVSDFATPAFYGGGSGPYSYRGNITAPQTVAKNGYIAWHDLSTGHWWRRDFMGSSPTDYDLGPIAPDASYLRGHIDRLVRSLWPRRRKKALRLVPNPAARAKAALIAAHIRSLTPNKAKRGSK